MVKPVVRPVKLVVTTLWFYGALCTNCLVLLESGTGQPETMLGAFDSVSNGHALDGLDRDVGLLDGAGQFTCSSFDVSL